MKVSFFSYKDNQDIITNILKQYPQFKIDNHNFELLIVIGGDGTFISALNKFKNLNIKILFFNVGKLGYLSKNFLEIDITNENNFINYSYLELMSKNHNFTAINEILLSAVNNPLHYKISFNRFRFYKFLGSGFFVSTKNGSTGLNRSLEGPILLDDDHFIYNEFLPVKNAQNSYLEDSIILHKDMIINAEWDDTKQENFIKIDGQIHRINDNFVTISLVKSKAKIYKLSTNDYLKNISSKLLGEYEDETKI